MITLRKYEELDDLEKLALVNMSYSRISTYNMCNAKYFYTYIAKYDRVFGAAASLGNILHEVLEDHVGSTLEYEEMLGTMHSVRPSYDPDGEIDKELWGAGEQMLAEFVDRHSDEEFEIIGKELPFSIVVGNALIRGFIDLVIRDADGVYHIIDYKSGKHEVSQNKAPQDLQLGIYALAINQLFGEEAQSVRAELYYLRSGRRKYHLFTPEDMEGVYSRLIDSLTEIRDDQNYTTTKNGWVCSFCDFQKQKICKTGQMRMNNW